jgi:hypothetical protein
MLLWGFVDAIKFDLLSLLVIGFIMLWHGIEIVEIKYIKR